jgi:Aminoacyl-tRNA editing domain
VTDVSHPSIDRVAAELTARGVIGATRVLPDSVRTAAQAAEALGCDVGAIANSLIFDADGTPILILTSGAHRVDTAKCARDLEAARLRRAEPRVRPHSHRTVDRRRRTIGPSRTDPHDGGHLARPIRRGLGSGRASTRRVQHDVQRAREADRRNAHRRRVSPTLSHVEMLPMAISGGWASGGQRLSHRGAPRPARPIRRRRVGARRPHPHLLVVAGVLLSVEFREPAGTP